MSGPSFWWMPFFSILLFDTVEPSFRSTALLATAFFCSFRDRDRASSTNNSQFKLDNGTLPMIQFAALVDSRSFWIPTASVVRYYTEMQSCLAAAVFPSHLPGDSASLLLSLCSGFREIAKLTLDTHWLVDLLDRWPLDRTLASIVFGLRWAIRLLSCFVIAWSGQSIQPAPYTCIILSFAVSSSLSPRLWANSLSRSTGLINIMLVASNSESYID